MPAPRGKKKSADSGEQIASPEQLFVQARQRLDTLSQQLTALCVTPPQKDASGNVILDSEGKPVKAEVQTDAVSVTKDAIGLLEDTYKDTIKSATGITPKKTPIGESKKQMTTARREMMKAVNTIAAVSKAITDAELAYQEQKKAAQQSNAKRKAERLAIEEERKRKAEQKISQLQAS